MILFIKRFISFFYRKQDIIQGLTICSPMSSPSSSSSIPSSCLSSLNMKFSSSSSWCQCNEWDMSNGSSSYKLYSYQVNQKDERIFSYVIYLQTGTKTIYHSRSVPISFEFQHRECLQRNQMMLIWEIPQKLM